jgi:hypothetical protein
MRLRWESGQPPSSCRRCEKPHERCKSFALAACARLLMKNWHGMGFTPDPSPLPTSSPWRAGFRKNPHPPAARERGAGRARCNSVPSPLAGEGQDEGELAVNFCGV